MATIGDTSHLRAITRRLRPNSRRRSCSPTWRRRWVDTAVLLRSTTVASNVPDEAVDNVYVTMSKIGFFQLAPMEFLVQ